jgi:thioesterase domain-containing protein
MLWRIWARQPSGQRAQQWEFQFFVAEAYDPRPYDGQRVALFRSEMRQTGRFRDPLLGWGELIRGKLDVHVVPGDHESMFKEPAIALLARTLTSYLSQSH